MPIYVTKEALKNAIKASKKAKTLTPELVAIVDRMCVESNKRYFKNSAEWLEDLRQDVFVTLLRVLQNINASKNLFAYLTTVILNQARCNFRSDKRFDLIRQILCEKASIAERKQ